MLEEKPNCTKILRSSYDDCLKWCLDYEGAIALDRVIDYPRTVFNGTVHLCVILTCAYRGQLWKDHQNFVSRQK